MIFLIFCFNNLNIFRAVVRSIVASFTFTFVGLFRQKKSEVSEMFKKKTTNKLSIFYLFALIAKIVFFLLFTGHKIKIFEKKLL